MSMNRLLSSALVFGTAFALTGVASAKPIAETAPASSAKKSKEKKAPHDQHHAAPAPAPQPAPRK
jgi:hypothetical protein